MRWRVESWRAVQISAEVAKLTIYRAFIEARRGEYTNSISIRSIRSSNRRTMWSLSNTFTSAFKELDPIPQFKAAGKLDEFLESRFSPLPETKVRNG